MTEGLTIAVIDGGPKKFKKVPRRFPEYPVGNEGLPSANPGNPLQKIPGVWPSPIHWSLKRLMATRQGWEMPSWLLAADMAELKLMLSTKSFELNIPREGPLRGLYLWLI